MKIHTTKLPGVLLVELKAFTDERGFFAETYSLLRYEGENINKNFVQDNISSSKKNVLRGLHYQVKKSQAKLVTVVHGAAMDVVVDVRKGSPTFGQWIRIELSAENNLQLYIPEGFAHGFLSLTDTMIFSYKCSDYYFPQFEHGIIWNDPTIGIEWGINNPILSEKDKEYKTLDQMLDFLPEFGSST